MMRRALLQHDSDEWATPKYIYDQAMAKGMYDPCPLGGLIDNLKSDWGGRQLRKPAIQPTSQMGREIHRAAPKR